MTLPLITGLYAGILGLIFAALTFRVGPMRAKLGIPLYDGGNKELGLEIRRHGNFTEYVPLALILMALLEMTGVAQNVIHAMGSALVVGRILHPIGLNWESATSALRGVGAAATLLVIVVASIWLIYTFITY